MKEYFVLFFCNCGFNEKGQYVISFSDKINFNRDVLRELIAIKTDVENAGLKLVANGKTAFNYYYFIYE